MLQLMRKSSIGGSTGMIYRRSTTEIFRPKIGQLRCIERNGDYFLKKETISGAKVRWSSSKVANSTPMGMKSYMTMGIIGGCGGLMGSCVGLGGGFVVIPLLQRLLKFSTHSAHANSLWAVAATSFGSMIGYARDGLVDFEAMIPISIAAVLSIRFGIKFAQKLDAKSLQKGLGVMMILSGGMIPFKDNVLKLLENYKMESNENNVIQKNIIRIFTGGLTGFCSGMFGIGGGIFLTPLLVLTSSTSLLSAIATSLSAMAFPAVMGLYQHTKLGGHIKVGPGIALFIGTSMGALVGSEIAKHLPEKQLQYIFGVFVTGLGLKTLLK